MKQVTILALIIFNIAFSSAYIITKSVEDEREIYKDIDDFKMKNPDVEIFPMDVKSFEGSRTYTLGNRQTGMIIKKLLFDEK